MQLCINLRDCLNLFALTREKLCVTVWVISHRSESYQSNWMKHHNQGVEVLRSGEGRFLLPRNTLCLIFRSSGSSLLLQSKWILCTQWERSKKMNLYLCVSYNWSCLIFECLLMAPCLHSTISMVKFQLLNFGGHI